MIPNNHKGINIVDNEYIGILYMGIIKCACLKHPIFSAIKNSPAPSIIYITISSVVTFKFDFPI